MDNIINDGRSETMEIEKVLAMAVAAIVEESQTDASAIRVVSFREIKKSALEQYISDHQINYKKYQLED